MYSYRNVLKIDPSLSVTDPAVLRTSNHRLLKNKYVYKTMKIIYLIKIWFRNRHPIAEILDPPLILTQIYSSLSASQRIELDASLCEQKFPHFFNRKLHAVSGFSFIK